MAAWKDALEGVGGEYERYRSCQLMNRFALNFNGRIDAGDSCISLCCENLPDIPKIKFLETAADTLHAFVGEALLAAIECEQDTEDSQRYFTAGCTKCAQFVEDDYTISPLISYVNLSMYPAPCQSRCSYCGVCRDAAAMNTKAVETAYEKRFDMLDLAKRCGILDANAVWQMSSGEIAIHPYRDRIMQLVNGGG